MTSNADPHLPHAPGSDPTSPRPTLNLQGASNFRDLGGHLGLGGRRVRSGRLFRSDHLAWLTDADRQTLAALGIARAFDFRGQDERAQLPYQLPGLRQHSLAIEPQVGQRLQDFRDAGQQLTVPLITGLMKDLYRQLVNEQSARFAELFAHLLADDVPTVFHCTAGKDRTGVAAALLLLALGVSREAVMHDYLLTNTLYRYRPEARPDVPDEVLAVLWRVQPDFLQVSLQLIDDDHGGIDRYLQQRIGLGKAQRQRLQALYLHT